MTRALITKAVVAGLVLFAASEASAACRQQFSHTTCLPFWQGGKCTNHFKNVCDAPAAIIAPGARPGIPSNPGSNNSQLRGGNLITQCGIGFRPRY
jgi:hypothetical protein